MNEENTTPEEKSLPQDDFHSFEEAAAEEASKPKGDTRTFVADGTAFLAVPDLEEVAAVRIGFADLPLTMEEKVPTDATLTEFSTQTVQLVRLVTAPNGVPTLQRSKRSNDGIWQAGMTIYVTGKWKGAKSTKKTEETVA